MPALPSRHCAPGVERLRQLRLQQAEERRADLPHRKTLKSRTWQAFRKAYLGEHPFCADCEAAGRLTAATEVHHKRKLADVPELAFEVTNLSPLCQSCHARRTARGE